jgi:LacI family fructose operon transcriptional repressor
VRPPTRGDRLDAKVGPDLPRKPTVSGRRTTIYDLAALAGASPTAVSSVLNGVWKKRRISEALAERITRIANEQGFALNMQASALRREKSNLIGMIVPIYDNRYFGAIAECFEDMARQRRLFPIVTCTLRDPELEMQAARAMIAHQVDCLVATGATNPDSITEICAAAGVRSLNLDLPGRLAPSVISDNHGGALALTRHVLAASAERRANGRPLLYVGGRLDHNTKERIRGFRDAHAEAGIAVDEDMILAPGYSPDHVEQALGELAARRPDEIPPALCVGSTISLEGVLRWLKTSRLSGGPPPYIGCVDWDPLVSTLADNIVMYRQDVPVMLTELFRLIDAETGDPCLIEVPMQLVA